jgi:hypothetical protein
MVAGCQEGDHRLIENFMRWICATYFGYNLGNHGGNIHEHGPKSLRNQGIRWVIIPLFRFIRATVASQYHGVVRR